MIAEDDKKMQIRKNGICGICDGRNLDVIDINDLNFYICEECIAVQFEENRQEDIDLWNLIKIR